MKRPLLIPPLLILGASFLFTGWEFLNVADSIAARPREDGCRPSVAICPFERNVPGIEELWVLAGTIVIALGLGSLWLAWTCWKAPRR